MSNIICTDTNEQLLSYFTDIDIGVVTALQSELDALIKLAVKHETIVGKKRTYYKLYFNINGKDFIVIAHTLDRMGISSMSITLMEILYGFPQLKFLCLVGIAAGSDSKKQNFGDILIPTKVYNYESGKYYEIQKDDKTENNELVFNSDYSSFDIDADILQKISAVTNDEKILDSILNGWNEVKKYKLKAHSGNFACGSAVIASIKKVKQIEAAISRKYIGIDMETFALASVNQLKHNVNPKMFIIKAITDFADSDKDDSEHEFASYTSAKIFLEVCSHVLIGIKEKNEIKTPGSKDGLLKKFEIHFNPTFTPQGADFSILVKEIDTSVLPAELTEFWVELINRTDKFGLIFYGESNITKIINSIYEHCNSNTKDNLTTFLKDNRSDLKIIALYPDKIKYFNYTPHEIREIWRTRIFTDKSHSFSIYSTLLRDSLIPQNEIREANEYMINNMANYRPQDNETHKVLASNGFGDLIHEIAINSKRLDNFLWVNERADLIAYYIEKYTLNDETVEVICEMYTRRKYSWWLSERLIKIFAENIDKKFEFHEIATKNNFVIPFELL